MDRKRMKRINLTCLVMLVILICSACHKTGDETAAEGPLETTGKTSSPPAINTNEPLLLALDIEPDDGFDPLMGWGSYGTPLFQSTLLRRNADQSVSSDLAKAWELDDSRRVWRITIRDDAVFSDGTPLTAKDVAFTFNQAAKTAGKTDVTVLEQAVVIDPYTVEIRLKTPQITFINRLITLGIVPAHAYGKSYGRNPVGSGPYRLVQWDEGRQMVMASNPYYYGQKPAIEKVVFLFMEEDAAFAAAKAGTVHVFRAPQMLAKQEISGMIRHAVPSVDNRGICFPCLPPQNWQSPQGYPVGNPVTADSAIRKAINHAVNRQELVEGILEGFGSPAHGPVNMLPWDQPDSAIRDNNPETARQILKAGGWQDNNGDGIVEKNGIAASFSLLYDANDSIRQALALAVSDAAKKIGIEIVVTGKSWDDIYKLMHSNAVLFGFGSFDQTEMHNLYFGGRKEEALHNPGFYANQTVDGYLNAAMAAPTENAAIPFWQKAQWDGKTGFSTRGDAAWAWLVNLDHTYFISQHLDIGHTCTEQHGSYIIANLPQWRWKVPSRPCASGT
ncbi:ABC transporter substrate-binding protein [Desulfosarcina ovata subsp. sediminis]|uniref:ABC transporter substrate-binding protein n=2 Tax=Desulfosarcina ovata TaxID=83564 RepID=A0A5K7ZMT2_9BACT|nr:ABC transporter substrate-binding protein [Desulfosarcina ovata subsp. sediminis]